MVRKAFSSRSFSQYHETTPAMSTAILYTCLYFPLFFLFCLSVSPHVQHPRPPLDMGMTRPLHPSASLSAQAPFVTAALLARGSAEDVALEESEGSSQSSILLPGHQSCLQPRQRLLKTHI